MTLFIIASAICALLSKHKPLQTPVPTEPWLLFSIFCPLSFTPVSIFAEFDGTKFIIYKTIYIVDNNSVLAHNDKFGCFLIRLGIRRCRVASSSIIDNSASPGPRRRLAFCYFAAFAQFLRLLLPGLCYLYLLKGISNTAREEHSIQLMSTYQIYPKLAAFCFLTAAHTIWIRKINILLDIMATNSCFISFFPCITYHGHKGHPPL